MNNYEEQLKTELKIIDKDNRTLQQENIYLREKCKQLQTTVKEVIEYINSTGYGTDFSMSAEEVDKVLNILQGSDKE